MAIPLSSPASKAVGLVEDVRFDMSAFEPRLHASTLQGLTNQLKQASIEEEFVSSLTQHSTKREPDDLEKDDQEKEDSESLTDSDSGDDVTLRPPHITDRRRAQNAKFSAW